MTKINIIKVKSGRPSYIRGGIRFSGKGVEFPADEDAVKHWPATLPKQDVLPEEKLELFKADPVLKVTEGTLEVAGETEAKVDAQDLLNTLITDLRREPDQALDKKWCDAAAKALRSGFKEASVKIGKLAVSPGETDAKADVTVVFGDGKLTGLIDFTGASENSGGDA